MTKINNIIEDANDLLDLPKNKKFLEMFNDFKNKFDNRNFLDFKSIIKELEQTKIEIEVNMNADEDIEQYNEVFDKIQAFRDRVIFLQGQAYEDHLFMDRNVNRLHSIWKGVYSEAKSEDRRSGEADLILSPFCEKHYECDILAERLKQFLINLSSKSEIVSRKISVIMHVYKVMGSHQYGDEKIYQGRENYRREKDKVSRISNGDTKKSKQIDWDQM